MPADRRTEEEIRREITTERAELADALADLREGVYEKRRLATVVGGGLAAAIAAMTAVRIVRRLKSG